MSNYGSFQIDLISAEKADETKLEFIQAEILKLNYNKSLLEKISASVEVGKIGVWEIFLEEDGVEILDDEDFLNLISCLESIFGQFDQGSNYFWTIDLPYSSKVWKKESEGWELIFEEENHYEENEDFNLWDE